MTNLIVVQYNDGILDTYNDIKDVQVDDNIKLIHFLGDFHFEVVLAFVKANNLPHNKVVFRNVTIGKYIERVFYKVKRPSCSG